MRCVCGQSIALVHGDHHTYECPMFADHDGIDDHINIECETAKKISAWVRYQRDMTSSQLADSIERGHWMWTSEEDMP